MPWYRVLGAFFLVYLISWSIFGLIYYIIEGVDDQCIQNIDSYIDSWFLALGIMSTIGYGTYAPDITRCPEVLIILSIETLYGLTIDAALLGVLYCKFARPGTRRSTIIFSKCAVIRNYNGMKCLMVQIANLRKHQILNAKVLIYLVGYITLKEGDRSYRFLQLKLLEGTNTMFGLPSVPIHPIDAESPLHNITYESMIANENEVLVFVKGIDESTSGAIQARYSYLPSEIKHNYRFDDMVSRCTTTGCKRVDYAKIHDITSLPYDA